MYKNKEITCPLCGILIKSSTNKCDKCGRELIISSFDSLIKIKETDVNKYINFYKRLLKDDPDNGELNSAIGICYWRLSLYDLAIDYLSKAVEHKEGGGDVYYNYALSLMKGRRPRVLSFQEIKKIEKYLKIAIELDNNQPKYYFFWACIKYDFYMKHGLKVNPPTVEKLLHKAYSKSLKYK